MHFILQRRNTLFLVRHQHKTLPRLLQLLQLPTWQQLWIMGGSANHLSRHNPRPKWRVFFSFIALCREMTTIHQEELKRFLINSSESKLPSSKAELFVLLSTISSWTLRLEAKAVSYEVSRATPPDTLVTIRTGWRWVYSESQDSLSYENWIKEYIEFIYKYTVSLSSQDCLYNALHIPYLRDKIPTTQGICNEMEW